MRLRPPPPAIVVWALAGFMLTGVAVFFLKSGNAADSLKDSDIKATRLIYTICKDFYEPDCVKSLEEARKQRCGARPFSNLGFRCYSGVGTANLGDNCGADKNSFGFQNGEPLNTGLPDCNIISNRLNYCIDQSELIGTNCFNINVNGELKKQCYTVCKEGLTCIQGKCINSEPMVEPGDGEIPSSIPYPGDPEIDVLRNESKKPGPPPGDRPKDEWIGPPESTKEIEYGGVITRGKPISEINAKCAGKAQKDCFDILTEFWTEACKEPEVKIDKTNGFILELFHGGCFSKMKTVRAGQPCTTVGAIRNPGIATCTNVDDDIFCCPNEEHKGTDKLAVPFFPSFDDEKSRYAGIDCITVQSSIGTCGQISEDKDEQFECMVMEKDKKNAKVAAGGQIGTCVATENAPGLAKGDTDLRTARIGNPLTSGDMDLGDDIGPVCCIEEMCYPPEEKKSMEVKGGNACYYANLVSRIKPEDPMGRRILKKILEEVRDVRDIIKKDKIDLKKINEEQYRKLSNYPVIIGKLDKLTSFDDDPEVAEIIKTKLESARQELPQVLDLLPPEPVPTDVAKMTPENIKKLFEKNTGLEGPWKERVENEMSDLKIQEFTTLKECNEVCKPRKEDTEERGGTEYVPEEGGRQLVSTEEWNFTGPFPEDRGRVDSSEVSGRVPSVSESSQFDLRRDETTGSNPAFTQQERLFVSPTDETTGSNPAFTQQERLFVSPTDETTSQRPTVTVDDRKTTEDRRIADQPTLVVSPKDIGAGLPFERPDLPVSQKPSRGTVNPKAPGAIGSGPGIAGLTASRSRPTGSDIPGGVPMAGSPGVEGGTTAGTEGATGTEAPTPRTSPLTTASTATTGSPPQRFTPLTIANFSQFFAALIRPETSVTGGIETRSRSEAGGIARSLPRVFEVFRMGGTPRGVPVTTTVVTTIGARGTVSSTMPGREEFHAGAPLGRPPVLESTGPAIIITMAGAGAAGWAWIRRKRHL